ncbi:MAG TPA: TIGR04552 family protein [Anaeromyxobacteraceae bacterium]|nr:TIGR04552 family protein [Anaeromyxobacteraceae bacterium]
MAYELKSMRRDGLYRTVGELDLGELEAIRLVLRGSSVVDWRRLHFRQAAEVEHFLRLNLFELEDPRDARRLRAILAQAVEYLRKAFGYRVAAPVAEPPDLRELFLLASGSGEPEKHRRIACVVLKCMHVVHHMEARELLFRTPIREADLAERVDRRVMAEARRMAQLGLPVVEFVGNVKTRSSLITKLLAKRETVAAQIFDRVRYRVVTERREQIPSVLNYLARALFPFNYVVPGQTQNTLVRFREIVGRHPAADAIISELQAPLDIEVGDRRHVNAFSGREYRALNFVVDLPVRVDEFLPPDGPLAEDLGRIVFSLVEFQVMDAATARVNEMGDSNHNRYKRRQKKTVLRRLSRGLVVPKRKRQKE